MATAIHPVLRSSCNSSVRLFSNSTCAILFPSTIPLSPIAQPRPYHSTTHPPPPSPYTATESAILSAATRHIPSQGFSLQTLSCGARDAGYIDASTNLFPRAEFELVVWWLWSRRTGLAERCRREGIMDAGEGEGGKRLGVGAKVKILTWERLMDNREIVGRWQEALALMAQPAHIGPSLNELASLSDEIFFLSGDVSVDGSWYTKRASLSGIYAASELFMTTDQSTEFRDTRAFMERRFRDVQVVGGAVGGLGQWVGFQARAAVNVGRSWGVRI